MCMISVTGILPYVTTIKPFMRIPFTSMCRRDYLFCTLQQGPNKFSHVSFICMSAFSRFFIRQSYKMMYVSGITSCQEGHIMPTWFLKFQMLFLMNTCFDLSSKIHNYIEIKHKTILRAQVRLQIRFSETQ